MGEAKVSKKACAEKIYEVETKYRLISVVSSDEHTVFDRSNIEIESLSPILDMDKRPCFSVFVFP
jgi:hypothetical protein